MTASSAKNRTPPSCSVSSRRRFSQSPRLPAAVEGPHSLCDCRLKSPAALGGAFHFAFHLFGLYVPAPDGRCSPPRAGEFFLKADLPCLYRDYFCLASVSAVCR